MLQFYAKLILGHISHLFLDIILHPITESKSLPDLAGIENNITAEQYEAEDQMLPCIHQSFTETQVRVVNQTPACPIPCHFDPVDWRA